MGHFSQGVGDLSSYTCCLHVTRENSYLSPCGSGSGFISHRLLVGYPKLCDQTLRSGRRALRHTNKAEVPRYPQGQKAKGYRGKLGGSGLIATPVASMSLRTTTKRGRPIQVLSCEKTRMFLGESCLTSSNPFEE